MQDKPLLGIQQFEVYAPTAYVARYGKFAHVTWPTIEAKIAAVDTFGVLKGFTV